MIELTVDLKNAPPKPRIGKGDTFYCDGEIYMIVDSVLHYYAVNLRTAKITGSYNSLRELLSYHPNAVKLTQTQQAMFEEA